MEVSSDSGGVIHTAYALRLVVLYQVARIFVWTLYHRPSFSIYCRVSCGHQRVIVEMDLDMTKTRSDTAIHQVRGLHWQVRSDRARPQRRSLVNGKVFLAPPGLPPRFGDPELGHSLPGHNFEEE
jgi:hypothetical protein